MAETKGRGRSDLGPGDDYFAITASDTVDFTSNIRALIVATAGVVVAVKPDNTTAALTLPVGMFPIVARRINSTGTTATGLTGIV